MTYPASITVLPNIFEDADGAQTESFTIPATPPYTHVLGASLTPPYPSGYQIVPPSGVAGVVSISGGGYGSWSEVTNGSSLSGGQFSVDYTTSPTGGIVTFSSADAGKSVTATWTGATLLNHPLIQGLVNALRDIQATVGVASTIAALDASTRLLGHGLYLTSDAHIHIDGTAPGTSALSNAGTGATASLQANSSDTAGAITITTGAAPSVGALLRLTFATALTRTPKYVGLTPWNTGGTSPAGLQAYLQNVGNTSFDIYCMVAPAASTVYTWTYHVIE